MIGFLSGSTVPTGVNLGPILRKRLTIHGTTLRARFAIHDRLPYAQVK